jgi:hypothetical protein
MLILTQSSAFTRFAKQKHTPEVLDRVPVILGNSGDTILNSFHFGCWGRISNSRFVVADRALKGQNEKIRTPPAKPNILIPFENLWSGRLDLSQRPLHPECVGHPDNINHLSRNSSHFKQRRSV